jgi:hypothetical protein
MRTLIIILIGLALLAIAMAVTPRARRAPVALAFLPVWLVASGVNLSIGLSRGYSLREELLVHLFLFGIPAVAALACWRRFRVGAG